MPCALTRGRIVDCKDQRGGLKAVYFVSDYSSNIRANATFSNGVITDAGFDGWDAYDSTLTVYKYDLRPESGHNAEVAGQMSKENGTSFFEQSVTLVLQKLTAADSLELRNLQKNRVQAFLLDNNDNLVLLGMDHGLDATVTPSTGTAFGDLTGYTVTLTGREVEDMVWIAATAGPGDDAGTPTTKYPFDGLADVADVTITSGS